MKEKKKKKIKQSLRYLTLQLDLLLDTQQDKVHWLRKSSGNLLPIEYSKQSGPLFLAQYTSFEMFN